MLESTIKQFVDQGRSSTPNIYDRAVVFERNCAYQLKSRGWFRLKPTHLNRTVVGPYALPMLSGTHMQLLAEASMRHMTNEEFRVKAVNDSFSIVPNSSRSDRMWLLHRPPSLNHYCQVAKPCKWAHVEETRIC